MNDPNYDDYNDFYNENEKVYKFLDKIFNHEETEPAALRNVGCKFTDKVVDYLYWEWEIDLVHYSHEIQNKALDLIDFMKEHGASVPNTAGKIAYEIIPI